MRIRTKSLLRYFTMADEDLPPSYVKRCQRMLKKFNKGFKQQATSDKLQAPSATKRTQLKDIKSYVKERSK